MKQYQNEKTFVEQFSADVKTESNFEVNGKTFSATYVGKNSGAQAVYSVTINGDTKKMNITQLKKRLGVSYTREQNRTGESKACTKFVEKTEEELLRTATNEYERYKKAFDIVSNFAAKHCASYPANCNFELVNFADSYAIINPYNNSDGDVIFHILDYYKEQQEKCKAEQAAKELQAAKDKAAKQAETIKQLLAQGMDKEELKALLGL